MFISLKYMFNQWQNSWRTGNSSKREPQESKRPGWGIYHGMKKKKGWTGGLWAKRKNENTVEMTQRKPDETASEGPWVQKGGT